MLNESIQALVDYAERTGLIESADRVWAVNRLLEVLHADTYTPPSQVQNNFTFLYNQAPKRATDWFYQFSQNTNYIRRVCRFPCV